MDHVLQDLRYAARSLSKSPGFTAVVVLTLALGIGATTAIYSVVDGVLLRPAPFADLDRLTMVWETDRNSGTTREPASVPDFVDFREQSTRLEALAAFLGLELNLIPDDGAPIRVPALAVSHDFLPMLGVAPILGRGFTESDDRTGAPETVVISEGFWATLFQRDPGAVGSTLRLNGVSRTIIGVLPDEADFGTLQILGAADYGRSFAERGTRAEVAAWMPLESTLWSDPDRTTHPVLLLGRLAPGASRAAAQQELTAIAAGLEAVHPDNEGRGVFVEPLSEVVFGPVRPALAILFGAVGLVFLVACVNVANLLLARGTRRLQEVSIRTALGAGMRRLCRQFLIESLLLTFAGAAAGVALAFAGIEVMLAFAPADIPRLEAVGIDARVLGVMLGVSVLVATVFGIVPTFQAGHMDLQSGLKGEGRGARPGRRAHRLRSSLVVAQLALAVVLLAGAGLLIRSFGQIQQVDAGFDAEGVLKAEFQLPESRYPIDFSVWPNFQEMHRFNAELLARVEALPGVESAAVAGAHPLDQGFTNSFTVVGREAESAGWPEISVRSASPGYFETVGLQVLRGRPLRGSDGTLADPVTLINETAAREFFPDGDALGNQISMWGTARTIVGVTADERFHGLTESAPAAVYLPLEQAPSVTGNESLLVRTDGDPLRFAAAIDRVIRELDPALAVHGVETLTQTVSRSLSESRFTMLILALFAALAIILAVIGVHGVLSYTVAQRVPEIGLRLAVGASRADVVGLVVKEGFLLSLIGLAIGLAGALALTQLLQGLLFGVSARDPLTFMAVVVLLVAVAMLGSWLPARRAARVDPITALRAE